jgi:23S rRNA (cytidine1920-2'-O)/16S rRNA (cytidine1409-2'-O)-methyltransferase
MEKERIDKLLVNKGLAESREKAQALIMAGEVLVGTQKIEKPSSKVDLHAEIIIKGKPFPFVSRGGIKLDFALSHFSVDVKDKLVMDVGSSTGGFSDCLLQRGAQKVYAIDVGYGQLAWKLQKDSRIIPIERQNVRYLTKEHVPEMVDLITIDVSFISLKKVIPRIINFLQEQGEILCLVKPQFEVGKGEVGKKGIVKEAEKHKRVVKEIETFSQNRGLQPKGSVESPILGAKGNKEFFLYLVKTGIIKS